MSIFEKSLKQKFKEAKESPAGIFALIYPYLIIIGIVLGSLYVSKFDAISRQSVLPQLPEPAAADQELIVKPARMIPPVDVMQMKTPSQNLIAKGKDLYSANCSSCHGADGKGDGPASAGLNPAPRNFTIVDGWKNGQKVSDIYKTLQEGIPGSVMASYEYLNPEDKFALAEFIRSEFIQNPPVDSDGDLLNLDLAYNLSMGVNIPAQIPVSAAESIILKESEAKHQKIMSVSNSISDDKTSEGAMVFNKVAGDKNKVLTMLANSEEWKISEKNFIDLAVNNVNRDGFNNALFNLNGNDWDTLFKYLSKYY